MTELCEASFKTPETQGAAVKTPEVTNDMKKFLYSKVPHLEPMETEEVKYEEHLGNMFQCIPETKESIFPEDIDELLACDPKPP